MENSFSKLKKRFKRLGSKHKSGRTVADVDGESVDPRNPPLRPGPYVVESGGGGNGADTDGQQASSTDQPPQPDDPELVPANKGGGEADIDGRKVSPMYPRPDSDIEPEVGVGNKHCRDGNGADGEEDGNSFPRLSTASIPHGGEPDGALMCLFKLLHSLFTQIT